MSPLSSSRSLSTSLSSSNVFITAHLTLCPEIHLGCSCIFVEDKTLLAFHIASVFVLGPGHLDLCSWLFILYEFVVPSGFSGSLVLFLLLFICILCYPILVDFITGRKAFKLSLSDT